MKAMRYEGSSVNEGGAAKQSRSSSEDGAKIGRVDIVLPQYGQVGWSVSGRSIERWATNSIPPSAGQPLP